MTTLELERQGRTVHLEDNLPEHVDTTCVPDNLRSELRRIFANEPNGATLEIGNKSLTLESAQAAIEFICVLHGEKANEVLGKTLESYWRRKITPM